MFKRIVILSLLACAMSGCIKEDGSDCRPRLRFVFQYTYNNQRQDLLSDQVRDIRVYLFDRATGRLSDVVRLDREDIVRGWIEPDIPDGVYTAVAWGGSGADLLQGGYVAAEMTDPATQTYIPQTRIGVTTLDNFRMMLACDPLPGAAADEVSPRNEQFDDLFFALAEDIAVARGQNRTANFDFIKNTSTLNIRVTGVSYLVYAATPSQPLTVFAQGKNEIYEYDNRIDDYAPVLHNEPPYRSYSGDVMDIDIRMQRLLIDRQTAFPVRLYIRNPGTGLDMVYPVNVVEAILQARDAQGNLLWPTQEAIDREDGFPIEISILHDLSVKVAVNGFEIVDTTPGTGRNR